MLPSASVIAVRDERQRRHLGRQRLVAHDDLQIGARGGVRGFDIAHGDRSVGGGPESAAGDLADAAAGPVLDLRVGAYGRATFGANTDEPARRAFLQLALDHLGADEAAVAAPTLADRPGECRLDRRGGLIDIVAVEAQAGLEPQRIAGAESD